MLGRVPLAGYKFATVITAAGAAATNSGFTGHCQRITGAVVFPKASATAELSAHVIKKTRTLLDNWCVGRFTADAEAFNYKFVYGQPVHCRANVRGQWETPAFATLECTADVNWLRPLNRKFVESAVCHSHADVRTTEAAVKAAAGSCFANPVKVQGESDTIRGGKRVADASVVAIQQFAVVNNNAVLSYSADPCECEVDIAAAIYVARNGVAHFDCSAEVLGTMEHWFPSRGTSAINSTAGAVVEVARRITSATVEVKGAQATLESSHVLIGVATNNPIGTSEVEGWGVKIRIGQAQPTIGLSVNTARIFRQAHAAGSCAAAAEVTGITRINDYTLAPSWRVEIISRSQRAQTVPRASRNTKVS